MFFFFLSLCSKAFVSFFCLCICILQGFTYPHEAGYPIESRQAKYYLMETHYNNLKPDFAQLHARQMADNSGLKIYFTHVLRPNDAGILSIGKYICLSIEGHVDKCVCRASVCACVCMFYAVVLYVQLMSCNLWDFRDPKRPNQRERERQRDGSTATNAASETKAYEFALSLSLCISMCLYVCAVGKGVSWRSSSATEPNKEPHTHCLCATRLYCTMAYNRNLYIFNCLSSASLHSRTPLLLPLCVRQDNLLSDFLFAINF